MYEIDFSFQRHFPINDILLLSGDISNQVAKLPESASEIDVLGLPIFGRYLSLGGGALVSGRHSVAFVKFQWGSVSPHWRYYHHNN